MIIDDKIRDKKLQYNINIEAAKISALLSARIDKYEYLAGEEILPSNQRQIKEHTNLQIPHKEKLLKNKEKNRLVL